MQPVLDLLDRILDARAFGKLLGGDLPTSAGSSAAYLALASTLCDFFDWYVQRCDRESASSGMAQDIHQARHETQVVNRRQPLEGCFVGAVEMAQIAATVAPTGEAVAAFLHRARILDVLVVGDVDVAEPGGLEGRGASGDIIRIRKGPLDRQGGGKFV
jgi:hypothetical protein